MRNRRLAHLLALVAAGATLAVAAPLASAGANAEAGAQASPCAVTNLVVWLPNGNGSGAAGSVYYRLRITNGGDSACTLRGFPRVSAVDLEARRIGKLAVKEAGRKATTVRLAKGASASFQLRIVNPGNFSPADCHPTSAAGLAVAPGTGGAKIVPLPFRTCARPTEPVLSVGPIGKS